MKLIAIAALLGLSISSASAQESLDAYHRKAMAKDYGAQRNTAFCLRTAVCEGIIAPRMMEACTWRVIILGSGHREVDASDIANYRHECLENLTNQERAVALTKAEQLFKRIYGRELPLEMILLANPARSAAP